MLPLASRRSQRLVGVVLAVLLGGIAACSGGSTLSGLGTDGGSGSDSDGSVEGGVDVVTDPSCRASYPVSQPLSAPCCLDRGADACGAGLFCAAFDGRTQPTCYPEHSRLSGEACTASVQCLSSACGKNGVCSGVSSDGGCTTPGGCGTSDSGSPHPGKCPVTCATNAECAATCPSSGTLVQCCDAFTSVCYASNQPKCPGP